MESSAKTGFNAQKIFIEAAKILYKDYLKYQNDDIGSIGPFKPINSNHNENKLNMENKSKGGCC